MASYNKVSSLPFPACVVIEIIRTAEVTDLSELCELLLFVKHSVGDNVNARTCE